MYLFFDTETTGLPANWRSPVTDLANWPRMVQLAWILSDESGAVREQTNRIIKPDGFTIPDSAAAIHGITTEKARDAGHALKDVLSEFSGAIDRAYSLVAHNMRFDEKIVGAEFVRADIPNSLFQTDRFCTMLSSTDYCRIPGTYGYKWPTLSELYLTLFNDGFTEAHDAAVDVAICAQCYFELRNRGIMK